ncbi:UNVERIFIED_CONTAM: hypothetical protein K2H54_014746 [Gekko kuhli]
MADLNSALHHGKHCSTVALRGVFPPSRRKTAAVVVDRNSIPSLKSAVFRFEKENLGKKHRGNCVFYNLAQNCIVLRGTAYVLRWRGMFPPPPWCCVFNSSSIFTWCNRFHLPYLDPNEFFFVPWQLIKGTLNILGA